nr:RNA-directed DNA polymerase, eukaryota [Tanacetum cinerariifolium]
MTNNSTTRALGFPRLFALEREKEVSIAVKMGASVVDSFRRAVGDGTQRHQMLGLNSMLESVSLSSAQDRWIYDLSGDGEFQVKEVRNIFDELFLPAQLNSTRWVKYIPIKINVFAWRARRDCLPTRSNLIHRGVPLVSANWPLCKLLRMIFSMFCFGVIWPRLSCVRFADGRIWIGRICRLFRIGTLGFLLSASRSMLSLCWKEFFVLLGGLFGCCGIVLFLMRRLQDAQ